MRIEILSDAGDDLVAGAKFYERRRAGFGEYFLNSLYSDIDSLFLYAGIHGDEVFITGLFANYAGKLRNVPIVQVGNLAAYPEERIRVRLFGEMDVYLIEARSIGGLSGSPVFYNPGRVRVKNGAPLFATGLPFNFMGIINGHYRRDLETDDPDAEGGGEVEALNTGIAIVVPVGKILNFINSVPSQLIAT
jgi:hypothetical protein